MGGIDLVYPPHWEPYIQNDIDKVTYLEMYPNHHVIKQGPYLSLHDEEKTIRISVTLKILSLLFVAYLL